ncbi:MAG: carbohydrate-binding domain-containing protein, partial [Aquabacterium sp.]|nr:carbohydrate-binding domain-containing protein [Aquabacterium sp.]
MNADGPATELTVRARGTLAGNVGPIMQARVDGVVVGSTEVRATEPSDYTFAVPPLVPGSKVDVVYTNNAVIDGVDRNLFVSHLIAGTTYALPD